MEEDGANTSLRRLPQLGRNQRIHLFSLSETVDGRKQSSLYVQGTCARSRLLGTNLRRAAASSGPQCCDNDQPNTRASFYHCYMHLALTIRVVRDGRNSTFNPGTCCKKNRAVDETGRPDTAWRGELLAGEACIE
ncbi:hypothetical protein SCLCIDRAFT_1206730 [Scleroderma citrinum Foug A]|uniref:Uncharacterized protein n=1 Tax=Scleroderma citrinum Foug A TaxID=1036808 RepID=A0A0C3B036_9AGAM|nr:hypothetical protein SCLCIDRAFT_1206730 [Scleroderma citrinum Foug A]